MAAAQIESADIIRHLAFVFEPGSFTYAHKTHAQIRRCGDVPLLNFHLARQQRDGFPFSLEDQQFVTEQGRTQYATRSLLFFFIIMHTLNTATQYENSCQQNDF